MTKKRRILSVIMAVALVASMMFAMTANTYAATDAGSATIDFYIYDEDADTSWNVDHVTVDAGQSVYAALNDLDYYEPVWQQSTDVFNGDTVYYLTKFMDEPSNVNVDHQYNADGSGWSIDWGWLFTVNDVMPSFPGEPNHGMAMNQYTIQNGDSIDVVYTLTKTSWDASYNTEYTILHPWK